MHPLAERLQRARKAAALSLRDAAAHVKISHAAIRKYEQAASIPSSDILLRLAEAYNVRIEYFFRPANYTLGAVKFRKRSRLSVKKLHAIEHEILDQIERRLEIEELCPSLLVKPFRMPRRLPIQVHSMEQLEVAAAIIRKEWGLGLAPIKDLVDLLEEHGIRVLMIDVKEIAFDGLAGVVGSNIPIIVVGASWPGDRQRFTLAHELGHLILSDRLHASIDEEVASHYFSGAFLLPREILIQELGASRDAIEMRELELIKEEYGISMQAQCFRLRDIGIISESYLRRLLLFFKKQGWTQREPGNPYPSEQVHVFERLVLHGFGEGLIGEAKAAELLAMSGEEFRDYRDLRHENSTRK